MLGSVVLHSLLVSALVPAQPPRTVWARADGTRQTSPRLLFVAEPTLSFLTLDEQRAAAYLASFTSRLSRWGAAEWALFGCAPIRFSTRSLTDGVRLNYFDVGTSGGALAADGGLQIRCSGGKISLSSERGKTNRSRQERVLFLLLLAEARQPLSPLGRAGNLAPSLFLPNTDKEARLLGKIDSACLYDRKGQFERLRKGG